MQKQVSKAICKIIIFNVYKPYVEVNTVPFFLVFCIAFQYLSVTVGDHSIR